MSKVSLIPLFTTIDLPFVGLAKISHHYISEYWAALEWIAKVELDGYQVLTQISSEPILEHWMVN